MARLDPNTYPDRLAFEAHVRRIRREEIGKAFRALIAWLQGRQRELSVRVRREYLHEALQVKHFMADPGLRGLF